MLGRRFNFFVRPAGPEWYALEKELEECTRAFDKIHRRREACTEACTGSVWWHGEEDSEEGYWYEYGRFCDAHERVLAHKKGILTGVGAPSVQPLNTPSMHTRNAPHTNEPLASHMVSLNPQNQSLNLLSRPLDPLHLT